MTEKSALSSFKDELGKFYYGFRELTWLPPIPLSSLRFFSKGTPVPNDVPGARIIEEIPMPGGC